MRALIFRQTGETARVPPFLKKKIAVYTFENCDRWTQFGSNLAFVPEGTEGCFCKAQISNFFFLTNVLNVIVIIALTQKACRHEEN